MQAAVETLHLDASPFPCTKLTDLVGKEELSDKRSDALESEDTNVVLTTLGLLRSLYNDKLKMVQNSVNQLRWRKCISKNTCSICTAKRMIPRRIKHSSRANVS